MRLRGYSCLYTVDQHIHLQLTSMIVDRKVRSCVRSRNIGDGYDGGNCQESGADERQAREKKEEAERQAREKKEEAERQEKKEEAERQEKKEEAERQERKEKEETDRKERLELEKMKLDAEMKLFQAKIEAGIIKNEPDGSGARSSDSEAKHPKLPNFQDGRDDLDIWLTREMEDLGVIRKSSSPYASSVVVVKKKDGTNCVSIDYRWLNKLTIFDPQPMTPPADIFQGIEKDQYFSKIDLSKGHWQIPLRKEDIPKTAFVTMDCHYEFLRIPFGMMNSGATLTRAVKKLLCGMDNVVDYIDDLLIHTETWEAHVKTLSELFQRLQEANFTVRPVKCLLGSRTVDFLGHSLGRGAIGLQDENVEKVRNAPRPKTKREIRAFLGLVGYYKEFVPNFAAVSTPLSDLVRKGQPNIVNWGVSQERAYNSLKVAVISKPVLQLPDVNKRFVLKTDTSNRGLGAALMQENEGTLFPDKKTKANKWTFKISTVPTKSQSGVTRLALQRNSHRSEKHEEITFTLQEESGRQHEDKRKNVEAEIKGKNGSLSLAAYTLA
ncbi:Zinc finger protein [Plakobranchus ocellatus]|uniref:Zinc finger protein n=1 Tax=Plakobranchus ocellatus TaxID=259542 RepID=A0AAV4AQS4_9GAST|nr:Zinc finger protein [Plakobranchus ocellatus]